MTPTMLYKDGGVHQRPGGTFSYKKAKDQDEFDSMLADGWVRTMAEVIDPQPQIITAEEDEPDAEEPDAIDLSILSIEDLRALGKKLGVKSAHVMGREKLIAALAEVKI